MNNNNPNNQGYPQTPPQQNPPPLQQGPYNQPPQGYYNQQPMQTPPFAPQPPMKPKKKKKWWVWVIVAVVVFIIIGTAMNQPDSETKPSPANTPTQNQNTPKESEKTVEATAAPTEPKNTTPKIGVTAEYKGLNITILDFKPFEPENEFAEPEEGNHFVYIEIQFENTSNSPISLNPLDWKIKTPNGELLSYDFTASLALKKQFKFMDLAPGGKTSGKIPFQVSETEGTYEAYYYSNAFDTKPVLTFELTK